MSSLPGRAPSVSATTPDQLADKALAAFVIIHAMLKRSKRLHSYSQRPEILERMPGFSVGASTVAPLNIAPLTEITHLEFYMYPHTDLSPARRLAPYRTFEKCSMCIFCLAGE